MSTYSFELFFQGEALAFLREAITFALAEDGEDLTSNAVFQRGEIIDAQLVAKEASLLCGLPIIGLILQSAAKTGELWRCVYCVEEGSFLPSKTVAASLHGPARLILRVERTILNFIMHLSGITNFVKQYAAALEGTGVVLLDTRKTTPCLRYPEKYAVLLGGGRNHRKNLGEMLMLKDNHIDAAGSVRSAVERLREAYFPMLPLEVECRTLAEVQEAVACSVDRIMLDNMSLDMLAKALPLVPEGIELEVSGGVRLENIRQIATVSKLRKPDFISVGRLTNSSAAADFSMIIQPRRKANFP